MLRALDSGHDSRRPAMLSGLATGTAVASAVAFAASTSLQHRAVQQTSDRSSGSSGSAGLIGQLLARPVWLAGQALAVSGLILHAAALHWGSVLVVQPVVISGVVLAVPMRSALERRRPWPREVLAVTVTAVGLTLFLLASAPTGGRASPRTTPAVLICLVCALGAALALLLARARRGRTSGAFGLGIASGLLFGAVAGLIKAVVQVGLHDGVTDLLTSWTTWALILLGGAGVVINQHAYQWGRLSASMPVLNVINGVVSVVFGVVGYDEVVRHSPPLLALEVLAFAMVASGLAIVAGLSQAEPAVVGHDAHNERGGLPLR